MTFIAAGRAKWHFNNNVTFMDTTTRVGTPLLLLSIVAIIIPGKCAALLFSTGIQYRQEHRQLRRVSFERCVGTFHLIKSSPILSSERFGSRLATTAQDSLRDELSLSRGVSVFLVECPDA